MPCSRVCIHHVVKVVVPVSCVYLAVIFMHLRRSAVPVQDKESKDTLQKLITDSSLNIKELLKADPEVDPKDMPEPEPFLGQRGLVYNL